MSYNDDLHKLQEAIKLLEQSDKMFCSVDFSKIDDKQELIYARNDIKASLEIINERLKELDLYCEEEG